jgi:hypothetical protein
MDRLSYGHLDQIPDTGNHPYLPGHPLERAHLGSRQLLLGGRKVIRRLGKGLWVRV